jgi:hypothetical protein
LPFFRIGNFRDKEVRDDKSCIIDGKGKGAKTLMTLLLVNFCYGSLKGIKSSKEDHEVDAYK